jgi:hypothetical protein
VIFAWPLIILSFYLQYLLQFNPVRAETTIAEIDTRVTLKLYNTWDENTNSGRYLTATSPSGSTKIKMTAFDWVHNARTGVYLTADRRIAILGPSGDDYLFSPGAEQATSAASIASDDWTYLGAFDFAFLPDGTQGLRFILAIEQAECIPMQSSVTGMRVRQEARRSRCNRYEYPAAPRAAWHSKS